MKKDEAKQQFKYLCGVWARERNIPMDGSVDPSYADFTTWLHQNGHSDVMNFRGRGGAIGYMSQWFDEEFKQTWKN